VYQVWCW